MLATCGIFKTLPKVNNRSSGENSPNLVTLVGWYVWYIAATVENNR
jgi:hypothetical protein